MMTFFLMLNQMQTVLSTNTKVKIFSKRCGFQCQEKQYKHALKLKVKVKQNTIDIIVRESRVGQIV